MAVRHEPTNIVHKGAKGGTTGCGSNTTENPIHWENTNARITCNKNGCKD